MNKRIVITIILVMTLLITGIYPANLSAQTIYGRYYGSNRIDTALTIADAGWPSGSHTVILAPADQANLVDALAAAPLAGQYNSPILLTYKNKLDQNVRNKLVNWGVNTVYLVGAISDTIRKELDEMNGVYVQQLKGKDRWETAKKINDRLVQPTGTIIVGYNSLADALSASSYAAANKYALVLADAKGRIPSGQQLYGSAYVIVGTSSQVADIAGAVRITGADSYERNKELLKHLTYKYDKVYIANGTDNHLVDSLVISPLAGRDFAPILLSDNSTVKGAEIAGTMIKSTSQVIALGGPTVISDSTRNLLRYTAPDLRVESVTPVNLNSIKIRFTDKVDSISASDPKNYYVNGSNLISGRFAGSAAALQEDEQSVILILYQAVNHSESINFEVKSNTIYDKYRERTSLAHVSNMLLIDNTFPTVKSVTVTGDNQLSVEFTETVRVPSLEDCERWTLDFSDLKSRKLKTVVAPHNVNGYDYVIQLNFDSSMKDGLGYGDHKLTVNQGSSEGQLSDAQNQVVYKQEITFNIPY